MEHDEDVERLFSWLKTPDLRYREFTGERERADAVAAWPGLREPAPPTARPEPIVGEQIIGEPVIPEPPPGSPPGPLSERLRAVLGRSGAPRNGQTFRDVVLPPDAEETAPPYPDADAAFHDEEDHREPPPVAPPPYEAAAVTEPPHEALFGGTYRGFENEEPAAAPAPPPEEEPGSRSLDGLFSRLAQPGSGDHSDHSDRRPRSGPSGLGPVFRRLR